MPSCGGQHTHDEVNNVFKHGPHAGESVDSLVDQLLAGYPVKQITPLVASQDRTLNEQEKRQVLDTIENQDGQVGTEGNFSVDAIRHKDDEAS